MIWLVSAALAQNTGSTASTGDTSAGFVRTALHDKIETVDLVVHAEVTASAGVTLLGGKRRWVQTLEVLEAFHQDHSRTTLAAGDAISFFIRHDDSRPSGSVNLTPPAVRLDVGEEAVYFLEEDSYTDPASVTHEVWWAHFVEVNPGSDVPVYTSGGSIITPIDYGGTTGKIAGAAPYGSSILRHEAGVYDWINRPRDRSLPYLEQRIEAATAASNGMPWTTFTGRVRSAAGEL
ncbi:MAG: hypothetical protein KTR31_32125 [Myxococcales bacterium]|nr:hypothetical protein [Myxococcales bacterium]